MRGKDFTLYSEWFHSNPFPHKFPVIRYYYYQHFPVTSLYPHPLQPLWGTRLHCLPPRHTISGGGGNVSMLDLKELCSLTPFLSFKKVLIYLFGCTGSKMQHAGSLILVAEYGIWFPDQGLNPVPLHWEWGVSATRPPGKSLNAFLKPPL